LVLPALVLTFEKKKAKKEDLEGLEGNTNFTN
jgi:hypothetical protein